LRLIGGYLARAIITASLLVLFVLLAVMGFIEFVGQLDDIGVGQYTLVRAIGYVVLREPDAAFTLIPIAVLIGGILGLGGLAEHSELIAVRAAGVSLAALVRAVFTTGLFIALLTAALGEYLAPPIQRYARQMRVSAIQDGLGTGSGESAWMRDGGTIINVNAMGDPRAAGVFLFQVAPGNRLASITHADSAGFDSSKQWILNNVTATDFASTGTRIRRARSQPQANSLNANLLGLTIVRADHLNGVALWNYVRYLRVNGLDARRYEISFWRRISTVTVMPIFCVLALALCFGRLRRAGTGARSAIGIALGLGYYLATQGLAEAGEAFALSPIVAAFLPTAVVAAVTAFAFKFAR
jgi:lipopolysaccharide export system permease protein